MSVCLHCGMLARFTPVLAAGFVFLAANLTLGNLAILQAQSNGLLKINHVVIIYQENWSFDSLYPDFPGANGIDQAGATVQQVDKDGKPYTTLPQPLNTTFNPVVPDPRFPADLPVAPFDTAKYVGANQLTGDAVHRYYQEQYQIDGGKMDKFVAWSDAAGLVMSYYDATNMPDGNLAKQFTMLH